MKSMIREIIDTDKASRLEVERAEERRRQLDRELAEQRESFEEKCREEAKAKIEMARQQLNRGLEENRRIITAETSEKIEAMQKHYDSNHAEWEDSIFRSITED